MATLGRPLSLTTIVKRLRHLRDNAFYDTPDQHLLNDIAAYIEHEPKMHIKQLHNMVIDLQGVADRIPAHLTDSDVKMLLSCVDGLAREEANRIGATKELKAAKAKAKRQGTAPKPTDDTPDWIQHNKAVIASIKPKPVIVESTKARSISAIIGAIDVLLEEAGCGAGNDDTFASLHHLVDVLDRLS
jgi:hypothetical protein